MNAESLLNDYFYDPSLGLQSAEKLYRRMKKAGINISKSKVVAFLAKQEAAQLLKQPKKQQFSSIVAAYPGHSMQLDLMIYDRYEYNGYKYVMNVVDVYSRFAQSRPLKSRKIHSLIDAFKDIVKVVGWPKNLNCDNEFNNTEWRRMCDKHNVILHFSQVDEIRKQAIVERFNRTLAKMIQSWRLASGQYDWPSVLKKLIDNYNTTWHSRLKATPKDLWNGKDFSKQKIFIMKHTFQEGDPVRIKIHRSRFDKGDTLQFSKQIYTVSNVIKGKIYLEDKDGDQLERWYKSDELLYIKKVEQKQVKQQEEQTHRNTQARRKKTRSLKAAGVDENNIQQSKRRRVPKFYDPGEPTPPRKRSRKVYVHPDLTESEIENILKE